MGIPATIESLSSLRSSFQLLAIKSRIKTTTEGNEIKILLKIFLREHKNKRIRKFRFIKNNTIIVIIIIIIIMIIIIIIKLRITDATAGYL